MFDKIMKWVTSTFLFVATVAFVLSSCVLWFGGDTIVKDPFVLMFIGGGLWIPIGIAFVIVAFAQGSQENPG